MCVHQNHSMNINKLATQLYPTNPTYTPTTSVITNRKAPISPMDIMNVIITYNMSLVIPESAKNNIKLMILQNRNLNEVNYLILQK